jgi:adenosine deaminase
MEYLKKAEKYLDKGVIGIGLGGSEHLFPAENYTEAFREAKRIGFRRVAHAGELSGADSVRSAVELLEAERIGHGTRSWEDPELVEMLLEKQIPLEVCVVSNVALGVCKSYEEHPIKDYFDRGLLITINSDDPLMFDSNLNDEYRILKEKLDFTMPDLKTLSLNGVKASFLSNERKEELLREFGGVLMELDEDSV